MSVWLSVLNGDCLSKKGHPQAHASWKIAREPPPREREIPRRAASLK